VKYWKLSLRDIFDPLRTFWHPPWATKHTLWREHYMVSTISIMVGAKEVGPSWQAYNRLFRRKGEHQWIYRLVHHLWRRADKMISNRYLVVDANTSYNILLGRISLNHLDMIVSTPHLSWNSPEHQLILSWSMGIIGWLLNATSRTYNYHSLNSIKATLREQNLLSWS